VLQRNGRHLGARVELRCLPSRAGRTSEAIEVRRSGLLADPDSPEPRFTLACALVGSGGRLDDGEARGLVHRRTAPCRLRTAPWQRDEPAGRLLVVCERGLGHTLRSSGCYRKSPVTLAPSCS
jgi:hypothetical protein